MKGEGHFRRKVPRRKDRQNVRGRRMYSMGQCAESERGATKEITTS